MNALRTLLTGIVDYAGLFPPAELSMPDAVAAYATYRSGPHAWMLGRFVLPVARFEEFERAVTAHEASPHLDGPWHVTALLGPDLDHDMAAIADINARWSAATGASGIIVDACEVKATTLCEIDWIAAGAPRALSVAFEIAPTHPDRSAMVAAAGRVGGTAKIRTGGTAADAIPSTAHVAAFIWDCVVAGVPFKATAGLHHPVRSLQRLTCRAESASAVMHGFLNVFVAAAIAARARDLAPPDAGEDLVRQVLDETDLRQFVLSTTGVKWRHIHVSSDELAAMRSDVALSFGSCSFTDPIADLEQLGFASALRDSLSVHS